jgi:prephenate dehydratase
MIISIQGEKGSFHHIAVNKLFHTYELLERATFEEVFQDVKEKRADFALVAIENSIAGSITHNYNRLARYKIPIVAEVYLRISHQLIAFPGVQLDDLREIWSHPMAIEQCREFLNKQHAKIIEKEDTAGSVNLIKEKRLVHVGAIASNLAAQLYDMPILVENVESDSNNFTRFLLLSNQPYTEKPLSESIKTMLHFGVKHKSGTLVEVLNLFKEYGVNMTKIESQPQVGKPWEYDFIVDVEGDLTKDSHSNLRAALEKTTTFTEIYGSYKSIDVTSV